MPRTRWVHCATPALAAVVALALSGCDRLPGSAPAPAATVQSAAETDFDALVAACTRSVEARAPSVQAHGHGAWVKVGYSPALVQREVTRTESSITPYVGKVVIKDNEAQASAPTEAAAAAITLTPAHLLSNRTHTFIYSFDGQQWRWQNGQRLIKMPGHNDRMQAVTLAEVAASGPKGFAGCLPLKPGPDAIK